MKAAHDKQYFAVLLIVSHLHVADPAFEIWQHQNKILTLGLTLTCLKRLRVEFGNFNIDSHLVVLDCRKARQMYQDKY